MRRKGLGLGYRIYERVGECPLCKIITNLVFVLGWGNVMRCGNCLSTICNRELYLMEYHGIHYFYMRGPKVIREGRE